MDELVSYDASLEASSLEVEELPLFEDDLEENLVAHAEEIRQDLQQSATASHATLKFKDLSLDEFDTNEPADALEYFWQPEKDTNHRLILPTVEDGDELKNDAMEIISRLDYLLVLAADSSMQLITIEADSEGMCDCYQTFNDLKNAHRNPHELPNRFEEPVQVECEAHRFPPGFESMPLRSLA